MPNPTSTRKTPAVPDRPYYNSLELALLPQFTRESYLKTFGVQAPPFDPSRRSKTWFDSAPLGIYKTVAVDGNQLVMNQFTISAEEAATVNLPGAYTYPAWNPPPTNAERVWGSARLPIGPKQIVTKEEALEVARLIGDSTPEVIEKLSTGLFGFDWKDEQRRFWYVKLDDGSEQDAAGLIAMMNANGVGHPGVFAKVGTGYNWVASQPATEPTNPALTIEVDIPMRELDPREVLAKSSPFMGAGGRYPAIMRKDLTEPVGGGGGGYTEADRQRDVETHTMLSAIFQQFFTR